MVSAEGIDEPQCLNYLANKTCRTLSYPINHVDKGVITVCLYGTFNNISQNVELSNQTKSIKEMIQVNLFCKECLLKDVDINISCTRSEKCMVFLWDFNMNGGIIKLNDIFITFKNVLFEGIFIQNLFNLNVNGYNEIEFENSTLSCYGNVTCGLYLANISAKVVFLSSYVNHFRLSIFVKQLFLLFYNTNVSMPGIYVTVDTPEFLKVPAIIKVDKVIMAQNRTILTKNKISISIKQDYKYESLGHHVIFDLINPYVIINDSFFNGIHLAIQSERKYFKPHFFKLIFERSSFINSFHVGNGGILTIASDVQNSEVVVLDCIFSNNSALKGTGNIHGRGGGLYVAAKSLQLLMTDSIFVGNKASDLGLTIYTTEGVDVSIRNCTFQHTIYSDTIVQQSILFVKGKIMEFHGIFLVLNPRRESHAYPIDIFYVHEALNFNIETYCPKWYNYIIDYSSLSTGGYAIPDLKYICSPCTDNYYSFIQNNTLYYHGNENSTLSQDKEIYSCVQCPYGALCTGNNVMPRPNYWGYWYEGKLVFQQCPADYCCSGSSTCNVYNYCQGNRTGTLCGNCINGFSVSILTGTCSPNHMCGKNQWFWLVVILVAMSYALWYTLKDDIFHVFALFFVPCKLMNSICNRSNRHVDEINQESMLVKLKRFTKRNCHGNFDNFEMTSSKSEEPSDSSRQDNNRFNTNSSTGNCDENITIKDRDKPNNIDKGYFGIVTYFVQMAAAIMVKIEFSDIDKSESFTDKIVKYIELFLNMELTNVSFDGNPFDVCPVVGLTTVRKHLYKLGFLIGIYLSWAAIFAVTITVHRLIKKLSRNKLAVGKLEPMKLKLIRGLIEIIKYTYAGFCDILFMSLVCTKIGNKYVWWYDGTNICLEQWQVIIIIFGAVYAVPFPFTMVLGLMLLKQNKISHSVFIFSCLFPLLALIPMLIYTLVKKDYKLPKNSQLSEESQSIISVLQGPYKDDERPYICYWEAMVSVRRLLITGMTLVNYASIRMTMITALCLIFLVQQNYTRPFQVGRSNDVEALSLSLLLMTSMINLLKAFLTDSGVVPSGPIVPFFIGLEFAEKLFVLMIIIYIGIVEIKQRKGKRAAKLIIAVSCGYDT